MERLHSLAFLASAIGMMLTAPAHARDIIPGLSATAMATVASDYRFRGVSLSARDPAVQGSFDLEHETGVYAGAWASTIENYGGADAEVDVYGGYRNSIGPVEFDVGAIGYLYPGGSDVNAFELTGGVATSVALARLRLSVAYAPDQRNLATDSFYIAADARIAVPTTPLSITGKVGRERGGFVLPGVTKLDWSAGIEANKGPFSLSISYADTDVGSPALYGRTARAGVVATFSVTLGGR